MQFTCCVSIGDKVLIFHSFLHLEYLREYVLKVINVMWISNLGIVEWSNILFPTAVDHSVLIRYNGISDDFITEILKFEPNMPFMFDKIKPFLRRCERWLFLRPYSMIAVMGTILLSHNDLLFTLTESGSVPSEEHSVTRAFDWNDYSDLLDPNSIAYHSFLLIESNGKISSGVGKLVSSKFYAKDFTCNYWFIARYEIEQFAPTI